MPEIFAPYGSSLLALAILTLSLVIQAFITGLIKNGIEKQPAGMPPAGDYSNRTWRITRTHMNGVETFSAIVAAALLAMIGGANPTLVAWLVWIIVLLRLAYWPIYYLGIGPQGGGIRSIIYVLALVVNIVLALVAILSFL